MAAEQSGQVPEPTADEISKAVNELRELVQDLPLSSTLSNVALRTFIGSPEDLSIDPLPILVEYLTWLYVCVHKSAPEQVVIEELISEESIERVRGLTKRIVESADKYYRNKRVRGSGLGKSIEDILDIIRFANLFRRGGAFPHHLSAQLHSLFDPFQQELRELLGFDISQALKIHNGLEKLTNDRIANFVTALIRESRVDVHTLQPSRRSDELRELGNEFRSRACKELRPVAHSIFEVTSEEVAQVTGVDSAVVRRFLEFFTIGFGQSDPVDGWPSVPESLERAPFLRLSADLWLVHLGWYSIFKFRVAIEDALERNDGLWHRYERHRSKYLERRAVNMIKSVTPHANGWSRLEYTFDDGEGTRAYELDGLVLVDQTAFLVEAKAGTMTPAARRGSRSAIDQIRRFVDEAQEQTARAARYIRSSEEVCFRSSKEPIRLRGNNISRLYQISVTLDSLGTLTAHKSWLTKSGVIEINESAWSVCDLDLEVVTELMNGVGELVSYLDFRLAIQEDDRLMMMDELDWLGLFFLNAIRPIRRIPSKWKGVLFADFARSIEEYYYHSLGKLSTPSPKPRQKMPRKMALLVETLERNGPPGFIDAVAILLEQSDKERNDFSNLIDRMWLSENRHKSLAFRTKLESGSVLCYSRSRSLFKIYVKAAKYSFQADRAVCILQKTKRGVLVHTERYPWSEDSSLDEFSRKLFQNLKSSIEVQQET